MYSHVYTHVYMYSHGYTHAYMYSHGYTHVYYTHVYTHVYYTHGYTHGCYAHGNLHISVHMSIHMSVHSPYICLASFGLKGPNKQMVLLWPHSCNAALNRAELCCYAQGFGLRVQGVEFRVVLFAPTPISSPPQTLSPPPPPPLLPVASGCHHMRHSI